MTRFVKLTLIAALLVAVAGSAYATDPQPTDRQVATSNFGPKPSGGTNTPTTHFVKPPGYDQDPWMHPYTRDGAPKVN